MHRTIVFYTIDPQKKLNYTIRPFVPLISTDVLFCLCIRSRWVSGVYSNTLVYRVCIRDAISRCRWWKRSDAVSAFGANSVYSHLDSSCILVEWASYATERISVHTCMSIAINCACVCPYMISVKACMWRKLVVSSELISYIEVVRNEKTYIFQFESYY